MQTSQDLNQVITDRIVFLQQFLKRPQQVGSITPSSRFLERRIVKLADIASARVVVELGGGTGGTTRALLRALSPTSTLLTIEINPQFCELLTVTMNAAVPIILQPMKIFISLAMVP